MNILAKFAVAFVAPFLLMSVGLVSTSVQAQDAVVEKVLVEKKNLPIAELLRVWKKSPHADMTAGSFNHWNDEGEIPGSCAVCHSGVGFQEYLKGPMSTPGFLDHPIAIGSTLTCETCHNEQTEMLTSVPFPSGVVVETANSSAVCMICHQGRASGSAVDNATAGIENDIVSADLGFINIHFDASASSIMGSVTKSGYEYEGRTYKGQFIHAPEVDTCAECHEPHSTEVSLNTCTACHKDVVAFEDVRTSRRDFDGNGNLTEGISHPIKAMHQMLDAAIRKYGSEVAGTDIVYSPSSYPYFFVDSDGDGAVTEGEAIYPNRYQSWTPRLLKAAYNYQFVAKDKAIYVHNPHYALQLLYDSLESLSESVEIDMSSMTRPIVRR